MSQDRILKEAEEAFSFFQPPRTSATRARNMLNTQNLEVALRSLGLRPPSVRDWDEYAQVRETASERFQYVNEQGKGQLDWEDFRFIVEHRLAHRDTPADLLQAFKVFDPAGSGRVPTAEMKKVLTALGNKLTTAEINEMITEVRSRGCRDVLGLSHDSGRWDFAERRLCGFGCRWVANGTARRGVGAHDEFASPLGWTAMLRCMLFGVTI
jgi:calmodulin